MAEGYVWSDGGRAAAGYAVATDAGDCFVRAVAIVLDLPYGDTYTAVAAMNADMGGKRSARDGVSMKLAKRFMEFMGWEWVPTMGIGTGCTVRLRPEELPPGRIIARVSKHFTAVIDGVVHDNHDPRRDGTRCVYGYWRRAS